MDSYMGVQRSALSSSYKSDPSRPSEISFTITVGMIKIVVAVLLDS